MTPVAAKYFPSSESGGPDAKPSKLSILEDDDSDSDGGARLDEALKVNEEYARRFEHNKKREERHRLEEKLKNKTRRAAGDASGSDDDETSSSNETEDEEGFLATEDLDAQISATLQAIRNKDPRVYDKNVTFVQLPDDEVSATDKDKKEKPVFLRDYQREKLLRGDIGGSDDEQEPPQTYAEEQHALRKSIVSEIHAAHKEDGEGQSSDDDSFMKKKEPTKANANGVHPSRATTLKVSELDVANADKNPEDFLSNFLASRAWIPEEGGKWKAFESDDDDDDGMADEWEQAYNMRFEDPAKSNEVLKSYARDFAAARSVRRQEKTGRKRQRELEREQKEEAKRQRREEKARLRKLKLEEAGEKLRMVKQAAGAVGKQLREEEWMHFLDDAWDNDKWEEEMQRRFGDEYYAMDDRVMKSDDDETGASANKHKKRPRKPKWDDDIDIKDIIPNFDDEVNPPITISSDEEAGDDADVDDDENARDPPSKKRKTTDHKRARLETQKEARRERSRLEALVDHKLELTNHELLSKPPATAFRYRETSPQSFGMTARDILLAPSDQALNDFAGLKKLASFRDEEKKRRDRKRLGKKARLREWRRGTFGREYEAAGPTYGFEEVVINDVKAPVLPPRLEGANNRGKDRTRESRRKDEPRDAGQGQSNVVGDVGAARKKRKRSKGKGNVMSEHV